MERELHDELLLCTPEGRLDPAAVGWSRRTLHRCNLRGSWPRKKRWDYWAITTQRHLLFLLIADVDYLGLAVVSLLDLESGRRFEAQAVTPFGLGVRLPETVGGAPIRFDHLGVRVAMESSPGRVVLAASARTLGGDRLDVDLAVEPPPGQETLNVVVPFGGDRFQFTSKHVGLPASGRVAWNGAAIDFDRASASLDFGRGIWPHRTAWNWAAASGTAHGRAVALNLGGRWTDGTGSTENGLWIDGRLHKIGDRVTFAREGPGWAIRGSDPGGVDLRFLPVQRRNVGINLGLAGARLDWSAGRFSGTVASDDGERIAVGGLLGWAEEFHARW
jgi:Protein of unknown function (DUF2804)